jgi:hypothetical protein
MPRSALSAAALSFLAAVLAGFLRALICQEAHARPLRSWELSLNKNGNGAAVILKGTNASTAETNFHDSNQLAASLIFANTAPPPWQLGQWAALTQIVRRSR